MNAGLRQKIRCVPRSMFRIQLVMLMMYIGCRSPVVAYAQPNKRVLIMYEMDRSSPPVELMDAEIRQALRDRSVDLNVESMETNLFRDSQSQQGIRDAY